MKQLFFGTLFLLLISACGAEDEQAKPLKFKSSKKAQKTNFRMYSEQLMPKQLLVAVKLHLLI
jgi:hypothetical protein